MEHLPRGSRFLLGHMLRCISFFAQLNELLRYLYNIVAWQFIQMISARIETMFREKAQRPFVDKQTGKYIGRGQ